METNDTNQTVHRALTRRRRRWRSAALLAVLIALGLGVAACGAAVPSGVASIGKSRTGQSVSSFDATALEYSVCMRSYGVPGFPEPTINGAHVSLNISDDAGASPAVFQTAEKACARYSIAARPGSPPAYYVKELLAGAECLSAHGVSGFPDPTTHPPSSPPPGFDLLTMNGVSFVIPSSIDMNSPLVTRAEATCGFPPPPM